MNKTYFDDVLGRNVTKCSNINHASEILARQLHNEAVANNEAIDTFEVLKKGTLITVEGFFKPEEWFDQETKRKRNRIVFAGVKFYPTPEKEEEEVPAPKKRASRRKK